MGRIEQALDLAARGFHVFPVEAGGKLPVIKDFPNRATRDRDQIERWFRGNDYNIGISTSKFGDHQALVVADVDNKKGKNGDASVLELEMQGYELPATFEQATPTGGRHLIYIAERACKQGVNVLGDGIDIRSQGGYIVGPGSEIAGKHYHQINGHGTPIPAPGWLVNRLGESRVVEPRADVVLPGVDVDRAHSRAVAYLKDAPTSVEGQGGDLTAYKVAAKLKDLGCTAEQALTLMLENWNDECDPPWSIEDLGDKISHAYRYGKEPQGSAAPEAVFHSPPADDEEEDPGTHPVDALNSEYAFIKRGAFILQETTDEDGNFTTLHLSPNDMHQWFANRTMQVGDRKVPLSKLWMARESRREYQSVVFAPQRPVDARFYNLWRGFAVEPKAGQHPSVDAFIDHALRNVCAGDKVLCNWLLGYFAHMIQRPWEKPLVALVFKGKKGTGKNALVERVGHLLGRHFMVADDDRYLLGNFNSHLESNLFFVLDEAAWAGDKRAEGKLKGMITGAKHTIERKGAEPYTVNNLTRVAIIGNEEWLVPVTQDERRFAVFNVGDGRKQDRKFFEDMRVGMEQGGYSHLLQFLMDFDLSTVDVNAAPQTQGLLDQKHASLEPVDAWWLDCLEANRLVGDTFDGDFPERVPSHRLHQAFVAWARQHNVRSRLPKDRDFSKVMQRRIGKPKRTREGDHLIYAYHNPGIDALRHEWEQFIGGAVEWSGE